MRLILKDELVCADMLHAHLQNVLNVINFIRKPWKRATFSQKQQNFISSRSSNSRVFDYLFHKTTNIYDQQC